MSSSGEDCVRMWGGDGELILKFKNPFPSIHSKIAIQASFDNNPHYTRLLNPDQASPTLNLTSPTMSPEIIFFPSSYRGVRSSCPATSTKKRIRNSPITPYIIRFRCCSCYTITIRRFTVAQSICGGGGVMGVLTSGRMGARFGRGWRMYRRNGSW